MFSVCFYQAWRARAFCAMLLLIANPLNPCFTLQSAVGLPLLHAGPKSAIVTVSCLLQEEPQLTVSHPVPPVSTLDTQRRQQPSELRSGSPQNQLHPHQHRSAGTRASVATTNNPSSSCSNPTSQRCSAADAPPGSATRKTLSRNPHADT